MNKLHVTPLPPDTTSKHLRDLFTQIGPVVAATVIKDGKGKCIMGIVEMSRPEDVEEILNTKDQIAIGGQRPYIWKPADEHTFARLMMGKDNGIHLEQYKGRWYVFEVGQGHSNLRLARDPFACRTKLDNPDGFSDGNRNPFDQIRTCLSCQLYR